MKKIAIFHNLPSGGAKRSLYEWVKRLSVEFSIDLYIYGESVESYLDIRKFCNNTFVSSVPFLTKPWGGFHNKVIGFFILVNESYRLAKEIDSRNYDWVFVHHDTYTQSPLLLRFLSTPSLYYCQEPFRRLESGMSDLLRIQSWVDLILLNIDRWAAHGASVIACNSRYSRFKIQKAYSTTAKVVYLGVDNNFFVPEFDSDSDYVLSVGRLHPSKGHDFCIKVIGCLNNNERPKLVVMGDSTVDVRYTKYLNDLAESEGVSLSIITVDENELPSVYSQAKLVLCCQVSEPLGLSALEAICCHSYVVGVSEGGILETIIDERVGKTVLRDVKVFSTVISNFLSDQSFVYDHEFADMYIKSEWTWDVSVNKILQLTSTIKKENKK
jgi:glycosyltransferase involved in cell wall biosynthesis